MQEGCADVVYPPTVYIAVFRGAEAGGMGVYPPTVYISVFRGAEAGGMGVYPQQYI